MKRQQRHKADTTETTDTTEVEPRALLTDVEPYETSIVTRGANRWPLLVVKLDKSQPGPANPKSTSTEPSMPAPSKKKKDCGCGQKKTKADDTDEGMKGASLSAYLEEQLVALEADGKERADCIDMMATESGLDADAVNVIVAGEGSDCPTRAQLEGFARALGVAADDIIATAEADGCVFDDDDKMDEDGNKVIEENKVDDPPAEAPPAEPGAAINGVTADVKESVLGLAQAMLSCAQMLVSQVAALPVVEQVDASAADEAWGVPWKHKELPPEVSGEVVKLRAYVNSLECYIPWVMTVKMALDPEVATPEALCKMLGAESVDKLDDDTKKSVAKGRDLLAQLVPSKVDALSVQVAKIAKHVGATDEPPVAPPADPAAKPKAKKEPDKIQPSGGAPVEPAAPSNADRKKVDPWGELQKKKQERAT